MNATQDFWPGVTSNANVKSIQPTDASTFALTQDFWFRATQPTTQNRTSPAQPALRNYLVHNFAVDIGQAEVAAGVFVGELRVVEPKQM